ncbi:MAG: hypothetical protein CVV64_19630 [Candidatus Wallbacteria bacterium HGW-Wallbacteria-1]|jgi:serine protease|uniref:Uncharacterized protein n=1 Tax=Candidatus Wallbacteria bacterium HGW-Wallbacteria-1 TaxID=2013854 RepID=A0A2N1PIY1_9BACT|nr:MAG: hypothetical protein CVV64_19630 [Candidatus Wallbacteria bacterium HGW-Wallbacteria-1]
MKEKNDKTATGKDRPVGPEFKSHGRNRARLIMVFIFILSVTAWAANWYIDNQTAARGSSDLTSSQTSGSASADTGSADTGSANAATPLTAVHKVSGWYFDLIDSADIKAIARALQTSGLSMKPNSEHSLDEKVFITDINETQAQSLLTALKNEGIEVESSGENFTLSVPEGENTTQFISYLPAMDAGAGAAAGAGAGAAAYPNDPYYRYQWHMNMVGSDASWPKFRGTGVIVAVVDTGIAYTDNGRIKQVEDLKGVLFEKGYDFVDDDDIAVDENGHGTHVAGTIAQATNNGMGVAGLAHGAILMPIRVLDRFGSGSLTDVADGIRWAADHGAKVINLSLGSPSSDPILEKACQHAVAKGCIVVCASGNSNTNRKFYPAGYDCNMAVSALDSAGNRAFYSNYGDWIDICAPGGDVRSDRNRDGQPDGVLQCTIDPRDPSKSVYAQFMGTSMAAPHVAGAAAVVLAAGRAPAKNVRQLLCSTSRPVPEKGLGSGCVHVGDAIQATGFERDYRRFFLSVLVMAAVFAGGGIARWKKVFWRPSFIVAFVLTISGLSIVRAFNLPIGSIGDLLFMSLVEWIESLVDSDLAYNPFIYSFLIPVGYSMVTMGHQSGKRSALAFCIGYATILIDSAFFGHGDVSLIPGVSILDTLWLVGNAAVVTVVARLMAKPEDDEIFFGAAKS